MGTVGRTTMRRPWFRTSLSFLFIVVSTALVVGAAADTPGTASELTARWVGRWVVVRSELSSGCAEIYTNNRIRDGEVRMETGGWEPKLQRFGKLLARAAPDVEPPGLLAEPQHLAAGELGTVRKVKLTGKRVDLLVDLEGRVLMPYGHGPFTLYREAHCKVQLQVEVPKDLIKQGRIPELEGMLTQIVERYESEPEARRSSHWNGRRDDSYPPDYEATRRAYTRWRNTEIDRSLGEAATVAAEMGADLSSSSAYYDGFFRGVNDLEPILERRTCETLVGESFEAVRQEPGMGEVATGSSFFADVTLHQADGSADSLVIFDRRGYEDGQRLLYALAILARLPECRLPEEDSS